MEQSLYRGISYSYLITILNTLVFSSIKTLNKTDFISLPFDNFTNTLIVSDIVSSPLRYLFEIYRSRAQINSSVSNISRLFIKCYPSLLIRDTSFRVLFYSTNSQYLQTSDNIMIVTNFIIGSFLTSMVSAPLDMVSTRMMNSQDIVYKGFVDCYR